MVLMKKLAHDIIIRPVVSEKAMRCITEQKYVFRVDKSANKIQIKNALQELFGVQIKAVNTMNYKGGSVRYRQGKGYKPDWKKAIVTLKQGYKGIEFFDNMT